VLSTEHSTLEPPAEAQWIWSEALKEMRTIASNAKQTRKESPKRLSKLIFEDLNEAQRSVSTEEQAAYQDAQQSVVDARRNAERHEGLLHIN